MTRTTTKDRPALQHGAIRDSARRLDRASVPQNTDNFTVTGLIEVDLRNLRADLDWHAASNDAKHLLYEASRAPEGATVHILVDGPADWGAVRYFRSVNPRLHIKVVGDVEHVRSWVRCFRGEAF